MMTTSSDSVEVSIRDAAQQLIRGVHELEGVLRNQRDLLRQRGMSLPPGALTGLQDVQIRLQNLMNDMKSEETTLKQLQALAETTALINSSLDLDTVLNKTMDTVIQLTGAERGYLMLRNEETGEMDFRLARNLDQEIIEQSAFTVSRSVVNRVAETGEPVITTNAQDDPRFASQESIVSFALRSILCTPLKLKDEITGVIYADNRIRAGLFQQNELELLNAFANQAAIAIENARLFERIRAALAEISELKDLMADVFASIPSGVIVTDGRNAIETFNEAAGAILNLRLEDTVGRTLNETVPALSEGLSRLLEAVRTENRRSTIELTAALDERGPRNLNLKLSPLRNADQQIEGVAVVLDDMTDLRQREAQLNVVRRYLPPAMVDNIQSISQLGLGGVRRDITAMYIDVRPIYTLPPDMPPKDQMASLNRYLAVSSDPIHRHGGVIDKYMGTEVMALFNTQLNPSETHSWDALQATLDMVDNFMKLYEEEGEEPGNVYYRIGIHCGIATMGNVGSTSRREFTAIGDTVNLAHRLVDMAKCGEILISENVFTSCEPHLKHSDRIVVVTDRGQIEIRGRRQTVRLYQVHRET